MERSTPGRRLDFPDSWEAGYIAAADFNGDGIPDLVMPNQEVNGTAAILLTQPAQTVTAALQRLSVPGNGTHQVKATYSGDSVYKASQSAATPLVALLNPTMTVVPSATSISTADGVSLSVTVTGGKGNPTPAGFVYLGELQLSLRGPATRKRKRNHPYSCRRTPGRHGHAGRAV